MIIDKNGTPLSGVWLGDGTIIHDGIYSIFLEYSDEDKERGNEIVLLKNELTASDYKALKHADGSLSDEDYEEVKNQRQAWRNRINELESQMTIPTLTDDEIKEIESKVPQQTV